MFPGFYHIGLNSRDVREPDTIIVTDSQLSKDEELIVEYLDGKYRVFPNTDKAISKFYNLFSADWGDYDYTLSKINKYYDGNRTFKEVR